MNRLSWNPQQIRGIIFDCDGVMIDSADANRHLYNTILTCLGLPPLTPEQEIFAFQSTFQQALDTLVPSSIKPRLPACSHTIDYDRDILPKIKLMPGFDGFISLAHEKCVKLAIDTNRTEAGIWKVLDHFHLPPIFDPVISSSNCEPKPSPKGAAEICKAWRLNPEQALFIGDSPDDRAAAQGAGIWFAGFNGLEGALSVLEWKELQNILWPSATA